METFFNLSNSRIKNILNAFNISQDNISSISDWYDNLIKNVPYQYLAHIMRTMEDYIRKNIPKSEFFRITCMPTEESKDELKDLACATYQEGYSFDIVYDRNMSESRKRVCIAHELGHLWLVIKTNKEYESNHEPLSSLFGLLIMLHKLDYKKQNKSSLSHKQDVCDSEEELIREFLFIMNRNNGRYNTSQIFK
ncbi:MAG: ImmA/IrrE family metallo-endopeptidase [Treponema sp.]